MKTTKIICPNCSTEIDIDEILSHQAEEKYKHLYLKDKQQLEQQQREFEEKKKKENEIFQAKLNQKIEEKEKEIIEREAKKTQEKYELEMKQLLDEIKQRKEENQQLKSKQLDLLKREEKFADEKKEFELKLQQERLVIKNELEEKLKKETALEIEFKLKQKDEQIEQIRKQLEEANRKATQGSMQIQGETQEHLIENYLKDNFPFDEIKEVPKGKRGADCLQLINTRSKVNCGTIIYESKNTKTWSNDWIDKLKQDKIQANADVAVLVTQVFPKNIERITFFDGVWVCSFDEFKGIVFLLRDSLIKLDNVSNAQQNKGDKMVILYDYFTGMEFKAKWTAIREGFLAERDLISKERIQMEKIWSAREKNLDKIIKIAAQMQGDIEGISDLNSVNLTLLDE